VRIGKTCVIRRKHIGALRCFSEIAANIQEKEIFMKTTFAKTLLLGMVAVAALVPLQAQAALCSTAGVAGNWGYTYTGTIFTTSGPLPLASVGHFRQNPWGSLSGSQTRSVAGQAGVEDISGTISVNGDCTASATINVSVNGQVVRTAVIALLYDGGANHVRGIFESLTLPDGTNVPVVITIEGSRVVPED
jgi:hypothetical protein